MFALVPPPPYSQRVHSDDPEEVSSWAERRDGDHSRVVHGTGSYGFEAAVLEGERVWLGWARTRLQQTLRARAQRPFVQVPIDGPQQYAFGRQRITVAPGSMAFIAQGAEMSRHGGPGWVFAMDVDAAALETEVRERRPDVAFGWPQFPRVLEPPEPLRRVLIGAITQLSRALGPDAPSTQRTQCENRVIAALADALTVPSMTDLTGRLAVRRLADLEAWIDAHLGETITIGRLCAVAQVGERSLQLAFQSRRGMSPMRFVCERRLAAAHRAIKNAGAGDEITGIATSLGLTHLGRFAAAYREVFGESPSRALQRRRAGRPAEGVPQGSPLTALRRAPA